MIAKGFSCSSLLMIQKMSWMKLQQPLELLGSKFLQLDLVHPLKTSADLIKNDNPDVQ